ncbi:hypothetical protein QYM36_015974 [Artemia franciscana]|uniref:Uncharacterized protein n=1 Tax=Artemia franciscana TaxID=6661 RepID=A0AA88HE63_ARTSF|nr:hypothetical protein QYM36_015974 [Artemia franciscana]
MTSDRKRKKKNGVGVTDRWADDKTVDIFKSGMLPSIGRRALEQAKSMEDELFAFKKFEFIDLMHKDFSDMSLEAAVVESRDKTPLGE